MKNIRILFRFSSPLDTLMVFLIPFVILSGCGKGKVLFEEEKIFTASCWSYNDTLTYQYENQDTAGILEFRFPVTFTEAYTYNNVYLRLEVTTPGGNTQIVPNQFFLQDATGAWRGEKEDGKIPLVLKVGDGVKLNQPGSYRFRLYHYMQDSLLCGIVKAGVQLAPFQGATSPGK